MNELIELNRGELLFLFDHISKDIFTNQTSWEQIISGKLFEKEKRERISNKKTSLINNKYESKHNLFQELLELLTKEIYLKKL